MGLEDVYTKAELVELAERHGIARINGKSAKELARDLTDSGFVYSEKADARRNPSYPRRYQGVDLTAGPLAAGNAVFTPLNESGLPDPEREITQARVSDDGEISYDGKESGTVDLRDHVEEKSVTPPDPNIPAEVVTADDQNPAIQTEPTKTPKPATDAEAK